MGDNIKMGAREIGFEGMKWIQLYQERVERALVNMEMKLRFP
jgi:hypothetical protein